MRKLREKPGNIATAVFVAWCAFSYLKLCILTPIAGLTSLSDFDVYHRAAIDILAGRSPYESPAFFYPPLVPFLMAPFGFMSYDAGRIVWFVLSHVLLLSSAWLLWRSVGRGRLALCCIAAVWAFGGAAKETLDVGQITPILLFAVVLAYTQRGKLSGAAIGISFALKYFPGILLIADFLHRRWKALSAFAATAILTLALPWLVIATAFTGPRGPISARYWMGTPAMYSWSLPSVVLRILEPLRGKGAIPKDWEFGNVAATLHLSPAHQWISAGTAVLTLAIGVIALVIICRGKLNRQQVPWAMAALVSLSLASAPVCWTHYQVLQYPGIAMLLISSIRLGAWRSTAGTLLCADLIYRLPQQCLANYYNAHAAWTTASPATLYLWTTVPPLACVGLFGLALWNVHRTRSRSAGRTRYNLQWAARPATQETVTYR